jgi:hypothetical protein
VKFNKAGEPGWGSAFLDIAAWQARRHTLSSIAFYSGPGSNGHMDFCRSMTGPWQRQTPAEKTQPRCWPG